jgi:O-antigen/teichoic acid export membrane protein
MLSASMWNLLALGVQYPLRLVGNLAMTQMLAPEAFGLMATAMTFYTGLALFSDIGIVQSVVRDPRGDTPRFLRTAWVVQMVRGAVMFIALVLIGLGIRAFGPRLAGAETVYADPRLPGMMWVVAASLFVEGFRSTCVLRARRRMQLGRITLMEILSQTAGLLTMISLGLATGSVWSLVAGNFVASLTGTVLSHALMARPRMRLAWDPVQATEMWNFGKWLIGSSAGGLLLNRGDRLLFSALIDKSLLGVYVIAVLWVDVGNSLLQRISGAVFMPSFRAKLARGTHDLPRFLTRSSQVFSLVTLAVSILVAVVSILAVYYLYNDTYRKAIYFIVILSFRPVFQSFSIYRSYIIFLGESRDSAVVTMSAGILTLVLMYVVYNLFGLSWSVGVFAAGWAPVFTAMLLHPQVRQQTKVRGKLLFMVAIVLMCMLATFWSVRMEAEPARIPGASVPVGMSAPQSNPVL